MRDKSVGSILFCESVSMAEVSPSLRDKSVGSLLFCDTFSCLESADRRGTCASVAGQSSRQSFCPHTPDLSSRSRICAALSKNERKI